MSSMVKSTNSGSKTLTLFQLYGRVGDVGLWEPGRPPHSLTKDPQRLFQDKKKITADSFAHGHLFSQLNGENRSLGHYIYGC